jgi:mRNA interferase MazF
MIRTLTYLTCSQKDMTFPRRGEIYLVASIGHKIQETRPAVIIQNDVSNQHSPIVIVSASSSQFRNPADPREAIIADQSTVILNRIRSIDGARLERRIGVLDAATMLVDEAIKISL